MNTSNASPVNSTILKSFSENLDMCLSAAKKKHHRRLLVLSGNDFKRIIAYLRETLKVFARKNPSALGIFVLAREDVEKRGKMIKDIIKECNDETRATLSLKVYDFYSSQKLMGRTFDFLILDLSNNLHPDDLGRLVETVRGGGLIVFITPNLSEWANKTLGLHKVIVSPPFTLQDVKHRYLLRFIKKLFEHEGITIFDTDNESFLKEEKTHDEIEFVYEKPEPPKNHILPIDIYNLAITRDQVIAINKCEYILSDKSDKKRIVIITADRGRGKSVLLGLALAGILYVLHSEIERRISLIVTSPEPSNVQPLFEFYVKALEYLSIPNIKIEKNNDGELIFVDSSYGFLKYVSPLYASLQSNVDVIVVDEAAGIPVYILYSILKKHRRIIYSSTIHGYEGAGRGFSIRFMKKLETIKDVEFITYTLEEPIRYASEDPIEAWLFDTLFLDAEPTSLDEKDMEAISKLQTYLEEKDLDSWFTGKNENEAKNFIGIYVYAHYRNRPRDVLILADAPHHRAFALHLSTGKIVVAIQVAIEGSLPDDIINAIYKERKDFHGQIIPHAMIIHQRCPKFGYLKGLRIVRIATHPEVMRRGLGSQALKELIRIARERGYHYIGAVFGANEELLRFWMKNGFIPVHISPDRNPISGEYSVVVIKPLTKRASKFVIDANNELRIKMMGWLYEQLRDMSPSIAAMLLYPWDNSKRFPIQPPKLSIIQWERLHGYALELMTYEATSDALRELFKMYFLDNSPEKPKLNIKQKALAISKLFQARDWRYVSDILNTSVKWCLIELMHITRSLLKFYTTVEVWEKIGVRYKRAKPASITEKGKEEEKRDEKN
ncbi:MAG: tRNA(Met) cytidine acetyltransferase [Candidatus Odinarchaeota archaeon]|nr:tRNA(Met) cytidine acetyltransferase [Candidatus Odinarchaeota archaeon]